MRGCLKSPLHWTIIRKRQEITQRPSGLTSKGAQRVQSHLQVDWAIWGPPERSCDRHLAMEGGHQSGSAPLPVSDMLLAGLLLLSLLFHLLSILRIHIEIVRKRPY